MVKRLRLENGTGKLSNERRAKPEQEKVAEIGKYLFKYGVLEGRNRVIDEEFIGIFSEALIDLDLNALKRGLRNCLRDTDRFPWPSHIRDAAEI